MSALRAIFGMIVLLIIVLINTVVVMYVERKVMAHLQSRMGPMRTGWHGLLQPIADALKLLGKEDLMPDGADRILFLIAPMIAFVPSMFIYAAMPWVQQAAGFSFDVGIFLVFGITALFPVGVLLGGWASHNKYSLLGGFRAAAQQISYEVPMVLSALGVVMLAGSMKLSTIVEAQAGVWNIFTQPLAFVVFFITVLAELARIPFDLPESESELVGGYNTEYSSMRFALYFVAEYANLFTLSLLTTLLFLGGWNGPLLPGIVWLLLKTYLMVFVIIWLRATLPRVRVDQLMGFAWKLMLPAALVSIVVTAVGIFTSIWVLIAVQLLATVTFFWIVSRLGARAGDAARATAAAIQAREVSA